MLFIILQNMSLSETFVYGVFYANLAALGLFISYKSIQTYGEVCRYFQRLESEIYIQRDKLLDLESNNQHRYNDLCYSISTNQNHLHNHLIKLNEDCMDLTSMMTDVLDQYEYPRAPPSSPASSDSETRDRVSETRDRVSETRSSVSESPQLSFDWKSSTSGSVCQCNQCDFDDSESLSVSETGSLESESPLLPTQVPNWAYESPSQIRQRIIKRQDGLSKKASCQPQVSKTQPIALVNSNSRMSTPSPLPNLRSPTRYNSKCSGLPPHELSRKCFSPNPEIPPPSTSGHQSPPSCIIVNDDAITPSPKS